MSFGKSRGMKLLLVLFGLTVIGGLGAAAGIYFAFVRDLPELRTLEDYRPPLASTVYDRNGAPIGGLKVTTENAWFAARPSGTEDVYKIYAESFHGPEHLAQVQAEAREVVSAALKG